MKKIILLLTIGLQLLVFAQLEQLQIIDVDAFQHTDFEKSFVFQSNDSLFYFYKYSNSTLNVDLSTDFGETWTNLDQITFTGLSSPDERSYDIVQKPDGTFLVAKLFFGGKLNLYSYNYSSKELTQLGTTLNVTASEVELAYLSQNTFLISLKDNYDAVFYYTTNDAAATWSNKKFYGSIPTNNSALNVVALNNAWYAALTSDDSLSVDLLSSTNNGQSWTVTNDIYSNSNKILSASIHSDNTDLFIVFSELLYIDQVNDYQTDVSYISSTDNAGSWSNKVKYTNFIGDDTISEINVSSGRLFCVTLSDRSAADKPDSYLGFLTTSSDPAPPMIYYIDYPAISDFNKEISIRIVPLDETGLNSLTIEFDGEIYTFYDDGNHNDSLANDNIYGTTFKGIDLTTPLTSSAIDVNNISMPIDNKGKLADTYPNIIESMKFSLTDIDANTVTIEKEVQFVYAKGNLGRYKDIGFLFSGGFMLSGYANSTLWANAVAPSALIEDYVAGSVNSSPDDPDNLVYSVRAEDEPFSISWQNWKTAVEQGAYFYDGDNDGIYDPVDKNHNGQWDSDEDKPDILYDAAYFTVYNDGRPGPLRRWQNIDPLGIEMRQSVFASSRNSILDDVIFVRYSLLYKGLGVPNEPDSLDEVIFSVWNDVDLGDAIDDLVGADTSLQAAFTYNNGEDDYFETNTPAVFRVLIQGPPVKSSDPDSEAYNKMGPVLGEQTLQGFYNGKIKTYIHNQGGDPVLRDPDNEDEARNYMLGLDRLGNVIDPCNWNYGEVMGGANCAEINPYLWYSGDPVTGYGWLNTTDSDQRDILSTEKFTIYKDQPIDIIIAYAIGKGTDNINSISVGREITQYVHEEYARNFSTIVGVEDELEEVVNEFSLSQNYPNPFNPTTTIKYSVETQHAVSLQVFNILGQKVKTLVNEVKAPGSYEVTFEASRLASGVYFYRLTSSSFMQTKKMILLK